MTDLPVALTIAGSDSGAGAGIQADLLTFAAFGVFGTTALAGLTAQNPDGVCAVRAIDPDFVRAQIFQVGEFFRAGAVKTGMLTDAPTIEAVADALSSPRWKNVPLVVDPVMISTSGARLLADDAVEAMERLLFPRACLLTPNLDEAAVFLGGRKPTRASMEADARALADRFGAAVLLKGGHLESSALADALALPDGGSLLLETTRIENVDTHGSGCTLSAAVAAALASGDPLERAVKRAHAYLQAGMRSPLMAGGRLFINHGADTQPRS